MLISLIVFVNMTSIPSIELPGGYKMPTIGLGTFEVIS